MSLSQILHLRYSLPMTLENFWHPRSEQERQLNEGIADYEEEKLDEQLYTYSGEKEYTHEVVPSELISTSDIFDRQGVTLDEIYEWYAAAIVRRDREPLRAENFISHFEGMSFNPTFAFGERGKGYLLGYLKYGVFVPTHFAPKTMRGGYELMKRLGESENVPAVMSVTEDLEQTLSKMPSWQTLDTGILATFRQELAEKKIVYNEHPDTRNLMLGLVSEYLAEAKGNRTEQDTDQNW